MHSYIVLVSFFLFLSQANGILNFGQEKKLKEEFSVDPARLAEVETKWMVQVLDHFNTSVVIPWNMTYLQNLAHFKPGGPLYIFLGGPYELPESLLLDSFADDLANETHGAVIGFQHRYHDLNRYPSATSEPDLRFLSSRQALADAAELIKFLKSQKEFKSSKVVVTGGEYAGNLAAWMRLLYPDLVDAALATSAPLKAKADFYEYFEEISEYFKHYGKPGCSEKIEKNFKRYETLFQSEQGIKELKKEFNICNHTDMSLAENKQYFFFKMTRGYFPEVINLICDEFNHDSPSLKILFKKMQHDCYDASFDKAIEDFEANRIFENHRRWIYQSCTEFGYFETLESDAQLFTKNLPVEFYYKICSALFGPEFNGERVKAGVEATNLRYGGLTPNVTQTLFITGELDPYGPLEVQKDLSEEAPAIVVPLIGDMLDLFKAHPNDSEDLKKVRVFAKQMIKKWIGFE